MSLVYVFAALIAEFALWFCVSHNVENPLKRSSNLFDTTLLLFGASVCYIAYWSASEQTPFISIEPVVWFGAINGLLAICISSALLWRRIR